MTGEKAGCIFPFSTGLKNMTIYLFYLRHGLRFDLVSVYEDIRLVHCPFVNLFLKKVLSRQLPEALSNGGFSFCKGP